MVIFKYNDVRAQIQEQIQWVICLRYVQQNLFANASWPAEEAPSSSRKNPLGKERVQRVQTAVIAGYLWSSAISALLAGLPLPLCLVGSHPEFLPPSAHICPKCFCPGCAHLHFLVFSALAVTFLVSPSPPLSHLSLLFSLSHRQTKICHDCIAHTAHFLYRFPHQYLCRLLCL